MNCPNCQTKNKKTTKFCRNCGMNLPQYQKPIASNKTADSLILIFLICLAVSEIAYEVMGRVSVWESNKLRYIYLGIHLITAISTILLGISIRNKTGKIFGIIIASLYAISIAYSNFGYYLGYWGWISPEYDKDKKKRKYKKI